MTTYWLDSFTRPLTGWGFSFYRSRPMFPLFVPGNKLLSTVPESKALHLSKLMGPIAKVYRRVVQPHNVRLDEFTQGRTSKAFQSLDLDNDERRKLAMARWRSAPVKTQGNTSRDLIAKRQTCRSETRRGQKHTNYVIETDFHAGKSNSVIPRTLKISFRERTFNFTHKLSVPKYLRRSDKLVM